MNYGNLSKERLNELACMAIDGIIVGDGDLNISVEYFHDQMQMTVEECEYFGIDITAYVELYEDWQSESDLSRVVK